MDVAIRDAMLPGLEAREFFGALRTIGVSSIEVDVQPDDHTQFFREDGVPHSIRNETGVRRLKDRLANEGVRVCALLLSTDFSSPRAAADAQSAVNAARAARELGAKAVRIDPLARDRTVPGERVRDNFVNHMGSVLRWSEDTGVDFGIENHGPLGNDPAFLDHVLAALPDPRLGLTLDTGNFYWFGLPLEAVYGLVAKYAPRAKHTHVKNINYPPELANRPREIGQGYKDYCCGVDEGNLDLRRVVKILRDAGYGRDLCIEDESLFKVAPERRVEALRRQARALREAMTPAAS